MACVVEPMTAAAKQHALRAQAQAQPGVPPKPLDPPCSAWLLLERDMPASDQVSTICLVTLALPGQLLSMGSGRL